VARCQDSSPDGQRRASRHGVLGSSFRQFRRGHRAMIDVNRCPGSQTLFGRIMRAPLCLVPKSTVVPILQGPLHSSGGESNATRRRPFACAQDCLRRHS
jgi:hypothetical protein